MYEIQNFIFLFLFLSFFLASRSSEWLVTSKIIIIFFLNHIGRWVKKLISNPLYMSFRSAVLNWICFISQITRANIGFYAQRWPKMSLKSNTVIFNICTAVANSDVRPGKIGIFSLY